MQRTNSFSAQARSDLSMQQANAPDTSGLPSLRALQLSYSPSYVRKSTAPQDDSSKTNSLAIQL
eukprot:527312-Pyramimonas_sp.AAC.1